MLLSNARKRFRNLAVECARLQSRQDSAHSALACSGSRASRTRIPPQYGAAQAQALQPTYPGVALGTLTSRKMFRGTSGAESGSSVCSAAQIGFYGGRQNDVVGNHAGDLWRCVNWSGLMLFSACVFAIGALNLCPPSSFNPGNSQFTWWGGSTVLGCAGSYGSRSALSDCSHRCSEHAGTKGVASTSNYPPCRDRNHGFVICPNGKAYVRVSGD